MPDWIEYWIMGLLSLFFGVFLVVLTILGLCLVLLVIVTVVLSIVAFVQYLLGKDITWYLKIIQ